MGTDASRPLPVLTAAERATTVANYPPFSQWRPKRVPEVLRHLDERCGADAPLGLYVHIPFDRQRCHCCHFRVTGDYSYRSRHCAADGVVLAGDAFAFLAPVFSSGMFLALCGGEMAVDAGDAALGAGDVSAGRFAAGPDPLPHGGPLVRDGTRVPVPDRSGGAV